MGGQRCFDCYFKIASTIIDRKKKRKKIKMRKLQKYMRSYPRFQEKEYSEQTQWLELFTLPKQVQQS